jgi:hypothetical protein
LNKPLAYFLLLLFVIALNVAAGTNIAGNFLLGIFSAIIAIETRRYFDSDVVSFASTILLGVVLAPYFGYLLWYAAIGARSVPAQAATDYLVSYVNDNFISSIPSTFVAAIGASIIDGFSEGL